MWDISHRQSNATHEYAGAKWKYGKTDKVHEIYGPNDWGKVSKHCDESAQSPINIEKSSLKNDGSLRKLRFLPEDWYGRVYGVLENNGHAPTLEIDKPRGTSTLTGGPLGNSVYKLQQMHIHFGCENNKGSEHTVNGRAFAGELHLVHYNIRYGDFKTAVDKPDGLAVIGVFIQEDDDDDSSYSLKVISGAARYIRKAGNEKVSFPLQGSLTTPPCYQSVQWIVLKRPIRASEYVMRALRGLLNDDEQPMCDNFRPTLLRNGRSVSQCDDDRLFN
ncbi:Carbonic anhydrase 2 [Stylophora pistillata]|uniref:Carbonic anhydrase n=1 Tax=Stylophora pistillata TaxID=50429 RepID=A0A2B4SAA0_STYPI|nr:Carbonic anhydrase 2 [Stylophora pistillata]